jgi:heptosyltransferase-2
MDNVLIIQTGFIGDVVLTTPLIDAVIAKHNQQSTITLVTTKLAQQLFANDPRISEVIVYDKKAGGTFWQLIALLRGKGFTHCYLPHKSLRSALLAFFARIPVRIGFRGGLKSLFYTAAPGILKPSLHEVDKKLSLVLTEEKLDVGHHFAMQLALSEDAIVAMQKRIPKDKKIAVVCPTSVWKTKQWSSGGFLAVANALIDKGYTVVITGAPGEESICNEATPHSPHAINLCGKTSIAELISLLSYTSLVVCNDSSLCHMAAAFKVPTVAVFCATHPSQGFTPYKNPLSVVVGDNTLECRPCGRHGGKQCPLGTYACIKNISPQTVVAAIEDIAHRAT